MYNSGGKNCACHKNSPVIERWLGQPKLLQSQRLAARRGLANQLRFHCHQIIFGRIRMDTKFDIFLRLPDGQPVWVRAVVGIGQALSEMETLMRDTPAEYFLFNSRTGEIIRP